MTFEVLHHHHNRVKGPTVTLHDHQAGRVLPTPADLARNREARLRAEATEAATPLRLAYSTTTPNA